MTLMLAQRVYKAADVLASRAARRLPPAMRGRFEDFRQEALLAAVCAADRVDPSISEGHAYIERRMHGAIGDYIRREIGRRHRPSFVELPANLEDSSSTPEMEYSHSEARLLGRLLSSAQERKAFECMMADLSVNELAAELGVSLSRAYQIKATVVSRLRRRVCPRAVAPKPRHKPYLPTEPEEPVYENPAWDLPGVTS